MSDFEEDQRAQREYELQQAIERAVSAADTIILAASDGSNVETDWLTAQVARKFMEKALNPFSMALLKKRLRL